MELKEQRLTNIDSCLFTYNLWTQRIQTLDINLNLC